MKKFNSLRQQVKRSLLPIALCSTLFTASALFGVDTTSALFEDDFGTLVEKSITQSTPTQINPSTDFLLQGGNDFLAAGDLFSAYIADLSDSTTDELASITGQYNTYLSPLLYINPKDHKNLVVSYIQDGYFDSRHQFSTGNENAGPTLAVSRDGGDTWRYVTVSLPTWLEGLGLGQVVGPQSLAFSDCGVLYFAGLFNQARPFKLGTGDDSGEVLPSLSTYSGIFTSKSYDKGLTWTDPVVVSEGQTVVYNLPAEGGHAEGDSISFGGNILPDPTDHDLVHLTWPVVNLTLNTSYGNIWYSRSHDKGFKWEPARVIYDLVNDPVWVANFGTTTQPTSDLVPIGGESIGGTLVSIPSRHHKARSSEVLLSGFNRFYPRRSATPTFTFSPTDTISDHAVIRSTDKGKTWSQSAILVGDYIFAFSHNPNTSGSFIVTVFDGSLNNIINVSPKTGRVYYAWQGGNSAVSTNPVVNQFFPAIQLASSADTGLSWSPTVTVSRTPLNPFNGNVNGANQSFNVNMAITDNGLVGIIYADYRNFDPATAGPTNPALTDYFLAIYRETRDPLGGSTGVGLDFVTEVRLTATSFDANAVYANKTAPGVGSSEGIVARGKQFLTAFGVANQNDPANINVGVDTPYGMTQDYNNRENIFFEKVTLD